MGSGKNYEVLSFFYIYVDVYKYGVLSFFYMLCHKNYFKGVGNT